MSELQWTYNGFTWGDDTDLDVVEVSGWLGLAPIETSDVRRGRQHGSVPGVDVGRTRTITHLLELVGTEASIAAVLEEAREAWAPRRTGELPLVGHMLGEPAKVAYCRVRRHNIPVDLRYVRNFPTLVVQFEATDPRIYSDAEHQVVTGRAQPGVGIAVPFDVDFDLPAASSLGVVSAPNAGFEDAPWTARLDGPLTNPVIRHLEQDRALDLSANGGLDIAAGQWVDIAVTGREVLLLGTGDRRSAIRLPESRWFHLEPGANSIELTADAGAGTLTLSWRDTWRS